MSRTTAGRVVIFLAALSISTMSAANLEPVTLKAWDQYVDAADHRMEQRLAPGQTFLWLDETPDRLARVKAGEVIVSQVGAENPKKVTSGLIHHWVGAIFVPHTTLKDVLRVADDYAHYKDWYAPTVVDSKSISSNHGMDRFSMLVVHKSFVSKSALDTEYESKYVRIDRKRGYSVSRVLRIQEIQGYGTPEQQALPEGRGSGFVWRLASIMRYAERDGGVYIEQEAMGLSRDVPAGLTWIVNPIVRRASKATLAASLRQTANAVKLQSNEMPAPATP